MQQPDTIYEIRVEGRLEPIWAEWFAGLQVIHEECPSEGKPVTLLRFKAVDPSALHGVLAQIGSLNLRLVSVQRIMGE